MTKFYKGRLGIIMTLALILAACDQRRPTSQNAENSQMDSVTMYCDEAFRDLIDQEIRIYEFELPDKHIHVVYTSEAEVLKHLTSDSSSLVVMGRRLREQERSEILHRTNLQAEEHPFATDAVAVISGPGMDRDTLSYDMILSLLTNKSKDYDLVFEGNGSGVINYMFAQIAQTAVHPSAFAAKNIDELADYLQKDKKAIGFIPFSRISDEHDTAAANLLKKVKVLYVSRQDSIGKIITATASQSEIADGSYALDRPVNLVSHSMEEKVGAGFVNFLYREKSGRIILKSGLVPTIMPQRVINVNTDGIK
jgi:phosphate transport system substrate-binding protein